MWNNMSWNKQSEGGTAAKWIVLHYIDQRVEMARSSQSIDRGAGCRDCFLGKTKQNKTEKSEGGEWPGEHLPHRCWCVTKRNKDNLTPFHELGAGYCLSLLHQPFCSTSKIWGTSAFGGTPGLGHWPSSLQSHCLFRECPSFPWLQVSPIWRNPNLSLQLNPPRTLGHWVTKFPTH